MVYGLKRVEGRGWLSDFRGPLWIHGAAKEMEEGRPEEKEDFYKEVYSLDVPAGEGVKFPKQYPQSALVGLVEVVDVVSSAEYEQWQTLPEGAKLEGAGNGSDYYFLCEKQQRLVMPFPMAGQHKLWKLDKKVAKNALLGLRDCEQMPISFRSHREKYLAIFESEAAEAAAAAAAVAPVPPAPAPAPEPPTAEHLMKKSKALKKKLKQIDQLIKKQSEGVVLGEDQIEKVNRHAEVKAEVDSVTAAIAAVVL
jgi:hypothetical protein